MTWHQRKEKTEMPTDNPIPSSDPSDLLFNAPRFDEFMNGEGDHFTDRVGRRRNTLSSLERDFPSAADNMAEAKQAAASAVVDADRALEAAQQSELARDGAMVGAEFYPTEAEGRAAVADRETFKVQGSGEVAARLYRRLSASTSEYITSFPASKAVGDARVGFGEAFPRRYFGNGQVLNGGVALIEDGLRVGYSIASNVTGASTYVSAMAVISAEQAAQLAGSTVQITAIFEATTNFLAEKPLSALACQAYRGSTYVTGGSIVRSEQSGQLITRVGQYVVDAADRRIGVVLQVSSTAAVSPTGAAHSVRVKSVSFVVVTDAAKLASTPSDRMLDTRIADAIKGVGGTHVLNRVSIPGDFASFSALATGITDSTEFNRYLVGVAQATYSGEVNPSLPDHVSIAGADRDATVIELLNPDNITPSLIAQQQPLYTNWTNAVEGITVRGRNVRYPLHSESQGANKDITQTFKYSRLHHLGNQGARNYQTSIGGNPSAVWASEYAFGCGAGSGQVIEFDGTEVRGTAAAFLVHDNVNFERPMRVYLRDSVFQADNATGSAVLLRPSGSGVQSSVLMRGNILAGSVRMETGTWLNTDPAKCPADRAHSMFVHGHGNSPAPFEITSVARALRIISAAASGTSTIAVSGTAVASLFGKVYELPGAGDANGFLRGYSYGWLDVAGQIAGTSLGARLGDCSSVSKTLTVVVDGGAAQNVVFNQNYTSVDNATILAAINAVLGASATADLFDITSRYRPTFSDEEMLLLSATQGISMGSAVAYDGNYRRIRKMTQADDPSLFAGIAWQDIYPGQAGRVKTAGYIPLSDLDIASAGTLVYGTIFSISNTPGRMVTGGSQGICTVIGVSPNVARVNRKFL